jgi:hypothetical protein
VPPSILGACSCESNFIITHMLCETPISLCWRAPIKSHVKEFWTLQSPHELRWRDGRCSAWHMQFWNSIGIGFSMKATELSPLTLLVCRPFDSISELNSGQRMTLVKALHADCAVRSNPSTYHHEPLILARHDTRLCQEASNVPGKPTAERVSQP